jgi:hypothetical protein
VLPEGLGKFKNHLIGSRTRDLPVCSMQTKRAEYHFYTPSSEHFTSKKILAMHSEKALSSRDVKTSLEHQDNTRLQDVGERFRTLKRPAAVPNITQRILFDRGVLWNARKSAVTLTVLFRCVSGHNKSLLTIE